MTSDLISFFMTGKQSIQLPYIYTLFPAHKKKLIQISSHDGKFINIFYFVSLGIQSEMSGITKYFFPAQQRMGGTQSDTLFCRRLL